MTLIAARTPQRASERVGSGREGGGRKRERERESERERERREEGDLADSDEYDANCWNHLLRQRKRERERERGRERGREEE